MQQVVNRCKPPAGTFYFGVLLGEKTVISVFKSSDELKVRAEGK